MSQGEVCKGVNNLIKKGRKRLNLSEPLPQMNTKGKGGSRQKFNIFKSFDNQTRGVPLKRTGSACRLWRLITDVLMRTERQEDEEWGNLESVVKPTHAP